LTSHDFAIVYICMYYVVSWRPFGPPVLLKRAKSKLLQTP